MATMKKALREYRISIATPDRVTALRDEAAEAGDLKQVAICDRALKGSGAALAQCGQVIVYAEAQR